MKRRALTVTFDTVNSSKRNNVKTGEKKIKKQVK